MQKYINVHINTLLISFWPRNDVENCFYIKTINGLVIHTFKYTHIRIQLYVALVVAVVVVVVVVAVVVVVVAVVVVVVVVAVVVLILARLLNSDSVKVVRVI